MEGDVTFQFFRESSNLGPKASSPYTVKESPQPGCHLIIYLFPPRESLVSDISAGEGKTANLFLQCRVTSNTVTVC